MIKRHLYSSSKNDIKIECVYEEWCDYRDEVTVGEFQVMMMNDTCRFRRWWWHQSGMKGWQQSWRLYNIKSFMVKFGVEYKER